MQCDQLLIAGTLRPPDRIGQKALTGGGAGDGGAVGKGRVHEFLAAPTGKWVRHRSKAQKPYRLVKVVLIARLRSVLSAQFGLVFAVQRG